jgi:hypothetical protein
MGIGSPRLLKILRCSCAVAAAVLWFAPSAFAEDGGILSASVSAGPVQATVAAPPPAAPAVPTTPATPTVSDPVAAARAPTPVVTAVTVASHEPKAPKRAAPATPAPSPAVGQTMSESFAEASAPARHSAHRGEPQSPRSRGHRSLPQGTGHTAGAGAFPAPLRHLAPTLASTPKDARNASPPPRPRPDPQWPLPGPSGLAGAASSTAGVAGGVLLFALATALGFLAVPRLGRVLAPRAARARPYAYLLRLERPD